MLQNAVYHSINYCCHLLAQHTQVCIMASVYMALKPKMKAH